MDQVQSNGQMVIYQLLGQSWLVPGNRIYNGDMGAAIFLLKKRTRIQFKRSGKDYRNVRLRNRIKKELLDKSALVKYMSNAFLLIGYILGTEMQWEEKEMRAGTQDWLRYIERILRFSFDFA